MIMDFLMSLMIVFGMAVFASINRENGFSKNVFLISLAIGFTVLIWLGFLPVYTVILSVLMITGVLFSGKSDNNE
jgi:hypothetical protein